MALTAEEEALKRQLEAKYGRPGGTAAPTANAAPSPKDLEAKIPGLADAGAAYLQQRQQKRAAPAPDPAKEKPSLLRQALHVAKGFPAMLAGAVDTPFYLQSMAQKGAEALSAPGEANPSTLNNYARLASVFLKSNVQPSALVPGFQENVMNREFAREEAPAADSLRTAVEWGGLAPFKAARGVSMLPDLAQAGGAVAGQLVDDKIGNDSNWGQLIGGLTGGLVGGARAASKAQSGNAAADARARDFIMANAENPEQAITRLNAALARGEKGTLADLTGDRRLFNFEAGIAADPTIKAKIDDIQTARQQQIADDVRAPFGTETPETAIEAAGMRRRGRLDKTRQLAGNRLDAVRGDEVRGKRALEQTMAEMEAKLAASQGALKRADDAVAAATAQVTTPLRPDQASTRLAGAYESADAAFRAADEQPAWNAFKAQPAVNVDPMYAAVNRTLKSMDRTQRNRLGDAYGALLKQANEWKGKRGAPSMALPGEVSRWMSDVKKALSTAKEAGTYGPDEIALKEVLDAFDEGFQAANPLYKEAVAATSELYERFRPGRLGKARAKSAPETLARKVLPGNEAAAEGVRLVQQAQDPALMGGVVEYLKSVGARDGITPAFLAKYGPVLDALPPETAAQFRGVVDTAAQRTAADAAAKATADQAAKVAADTARKTSALEKSTLKAEVELPATVSRLRTTIDRNVVSQYATTPATTVRSLLDNKDGAGKLGRLFRYLDSAGEGAAFRGHIRDELSRRLLIANDASTAVKPKAMGDYMKLRDNLVKSGVISADEADTIGTALKRTETSKLRLSAVRERLDNNANEIDNLLASGISAALVGALPGSQSLLVGGALRRMMRKIIVSNKVKPEELQALERMLLDPEAFARGLNNPRTAEEATMQLMTKLVGRGQALQLINEDKENN